MTDLAALLPADARSTWPVDDLDQSMCAWAGLKCTASDGSPRRLLALDAASFRLAGTLPDSIGNLSTLVRLDVSRNSLVDPLPSSLTRLTALTQLHLAFNADLSILPVGLERLARLEILDLWACSFSGQIPSEWSAFPNLKYLDVWGNRLHGPFPPWLASMSSLVFLSLGHLALDSVIPSNICQLTNLTALLLNSASLSGRLPECLDQLTKLEYLWLAGNSFDGPFPAVLCGSGNSPVLPLALVHIDLSHNSFSGELPTNADACWSNLANLRILDLSYNRFNGTLETTGIAALTALETLKLKNNRFSGPIPWASFEFMLYLLVADMRSNQLSRIALSANDCPPFPESQSLVVRDSSLVKLIVSDNLINDSIETLFLCLRRYTPWVAIVDFSRNHLFGRVTEQSLNTRARLSGIVQFEPGNALTMLATVNLSRNAVTGDPTDRWNSYSTLSPSIFDVSFNNMQGGLALPYLAQSPDQSCLINVRGNPIAPLYSPDEYDSLVIGARLAPVLRARLRWVLDASVALPSASTPALQCSRLTPACMGDILIDDAYLDFRHCSCAAQNSAWDQTTRRCFPCPDRLQCSPNVTLPLHRVQPGYFPVWALADIANQFQLDSQAVLTTPTCTLFGDHSSPFLSPACVLSTLLPAFVNRSYSASLPVSFTIAGEQGRLLKTSALLLRCLYPGHCIGSGASGGGATAALATPISLNASDWPTALFACSAGRDPGSFLCSECLDYHYQSGVGRPCLRCPDSFRTWVPVLDTIALCVLVWFFFRQNTPGHGSAGFSIIVAWLQIFSLLKQTGLTYVDPASTSPTQVSALFAGLQTLANFNPFAVECVVGRFTFTNRFYTQLSLPCLVVVVGAIGILLTRKATDAVVGTSAVDCSRAAAATAETAIDASMSASIEGRTRGDSHIELLATAVDANAATALALGESPLAGESDGSALSAASAQSLGRGSATFRSISHAIHPPSKVYGVRAPRPAASHGLVQRLVSPDHFRAPSFSTAAPAQPAPHPPARAFDWTVAWCLDRVMNRSPPVRGPAPPAPTTRARILHVVVRLLWLLYIDVVTLTLSAFDCQSQPDDIIDAAYAPPSAFLQQSRFRYLSIAPNISCASATYTRLVVTAAFALLAYVVGIPVVLGFVQHRLRRLASKTAIAPIPAPLTTADRVSAHASVERVLPSHGRRRSHSSARSRPVSLRRSSSAHDDAHALPPSLILGSSLLEHGGNSSTLDMAGGFDGTIMDTGAYVALFDAEHESARPLEAPTSPVVRSAKGAHALICGVSAASLEHAMLFLVKCVRKELWWWPLSVGLLRAFVLVAIVTQLPSNSIFLPLGVATVLLASAAAVLHAQPYLLRFNNVLEVVLMLHLTLFFVFGVLAQSVSFRAPLDAATDTSTAAAASFSFITIGSIKSAQFFLEELASILIVSVFCAMELFARCIGPRLSPRSALRRCLL